MHLLLAPIADEQAHEYHERQRDTHGARDSDHRRQLDWQPGRGRRLGRRQRRQLLALRVGLEEDGVPGGDSGASTRRLPRDQRLVGRVGVGRVGLVERGARQRRGGEPRVRQRRGGGEAGVHVEREHAGHEVEEELVLRAEHVSECTRPVRGAGRRHGAAGLRGCGAAWQDAWQACCWMMGQGVACAWHVHVHGVRMCIPRVDVKALAVRLAQVQPLLRKVERRVAALVEHVIGHLARESHLAGEQRLRAVRAGVELVI